MVSLPWLVLKTYCTQFWSSPPSTFQEIFCFFGGPEKGPLTSVSRIIFKNVTDQKFHAEDLPEVPKCHRDPCFSMEEPGELLGTWLPNLQANSGGQKMSTPWAKGSTVALRTLYHCLHLTLQWREKPMRYIKNLTLSWETGWEPKQMAALSRPRGWFHLNLLDLGFQWVFHRRFHTPHRG